MKVANLDGLELRRYELQIENALRQRRMNNMVKFDDLSLSSVEAGIEYLIQQRIELGENRQLAELSVTRTAQGRILWNQARKLRMAESADSPSSSLFSKTAASLIGHQARLENLIDQRMSEHNETRECAERAVIHTSDGLELWERMRALKLAESRDDD